MAEARVSPITVRPAEARDAGLQQAFFAGLSHESRYHRFMSPLREVPAALLEQLTRVDQRDHVALLAETGGAVIGEARYVRDGTAAEFAVAVADAWQGLGLGRRLLTELEHRAATTGVQRLVGDTLRSNAGMIALGRRAGFAIRPGAGGLWTVQQVKDLGAEVPLAA